MASETGARTGQGALFAFIAAFGGFVFGLDIANISGALRFVGAQYELDALQTGLLAGSGILGVILALFFAGTLCERYGRKPILIAIALTYSLSSLLSAFAVSFEMLLIGRFIGGIAFASITVSAMYIGEIAPDDRRGRFGSVSQLLIVLGSLVAFTVNFFLIKSLPGSSWLTETNIWRYMLGFELIANAIWVSSLFIIPESPRWLIKKGRVPEARTAFERIGTSKPIDVTVNDVERSLEGEEDSTPFEQLRTLFGRSFWHVLAIAVVYAIVQGGSGMNAVNVFAPMVFEQIGMSTESAFLQTIIVGGIQVAATIIAIVSIEKFGRRALTLAGLCLVIVAHLSTSVGFSRATYTFTEGAVAEVVETRPTLDASRFAPFVGKTFNSDVELKRDLAAEFNASELPLITGPVINATIDINPLLVMFGIFAFLAAFNLSIGPVMWVVFSEIFPNRARSVAIPFVALVQSIAGYIIQQFFPWQLENLGASGTFLIYAVVAAIGLAVLFFILPETRNRSIEELERELIGTERQGA